MMSAQMHLTNGTRLRDLCADTLGSGVGTVNIYDDNGGNITFFLDRAEDAREIAAAFLSLANLLEPAKAEPVVVATPESGC